MLTGGRTAAEKRPSERPRTRLGLPRRSGCAARSLLGAVPTSQRRWAAESAGDALIHGRTVFYTPKGWVGARSRCALITQARRGLPSQPAAAGTKRMCMAPRRSVSPMEPHPLGGSGLGTSEWRTLCEHSRITLRIVYFGELMSREKIGGYQCERCSQKLGSETDTCQGTSRVPETVRFLTGTSQDEPKGKRHGKG